MADTAQWMDIKDFLNLKSGDDVEVFNHYAQRSIKATVLDPPEIDKDGEYTEEGARIIYVLLGGFGSRYVEWIRQATPGPMGYLQVMDGFASSTNEMDAIWY